MGDLITGKWGIRCTAKSKRSQEQCKNMAVIGAATCRSHNGGSPNTKPSRSRDKTASNRAMIEQRVQELGDQAVETVRAILDDDTVKPEVRIRAAETVLDRIVGKKIEAEVTRHEERDLDAEIEAELGVLPEPEAEETA